MYFAGRTDSAEKSLSTRFIGYVEKTNYFTLLNNPTILIIYNLIRYKGLNIK